MTLDLNEQIYDFALHCIIQVFMILSPDPVVFSHIHFYSLQHKGHHVLSKRMCRDILGQ